MVDYRDTHELILTVESMKKPATFLVDTFFRNMLPVSLSRYVDVEYHTGGRVLAPYVSEGGAGVNVARTGTFIQSFRPPMVAPKRIVNVEDIEMRDIGESIQATKSAGQRFSSIQARDLNELIGAIQNRKNQMASEILTTGKVTCKGYADDMKIEKLSQIDFGWQGKMNPTTAWNSINADIYADFQSMSEWIQENAGSIPTVAIIGKNVASYLINNDKIMKWLSIPSRENFGLMSLQPRLESPQIMRIGLIQALNLEIYSYSETYTDEYGVTQPFFPANGVLVAIPGFGSQLHASVTTFDRDGKLLSWANEFVPVYQVSPEGQSMSLTLRSRFLLVPTQRDSYVYMDCTDVVSSGSEISNSGSEIVGSESSLPGYEG